MIRLHEAMDLMLAATGQEGAHGIRDGVGLHHHPDHTQCHDEEHREDDGEPLVVHSVADVIGWSAHHVSVRIDMFIGLSQRCFGKVGGHAADGTHP